ARGARAGLTLGGRRSTASDTLEARNVAESIANAQPGPSPATISPAIAGPAAHAQLRDRLISAFACWRRPAETVSGTRPVEAGAQNASPAPETAKSTNRGQIRASPDSRSAATS